MAATNFTPIQLYFSTTASAVPLAANLAQGELAINITDGKLYYEDNAGVVQVIATKGAGTIGGSNTQIQYNNAGALAGNAAMTFNSATSTTTLTTLNLTNALGATFGGTAQSSYTQGDILYSSATNTLAKLGIGTVNFILTSTGSVPQWVAPTSITVQTANNLAGGAAGSVPYQSAPDTTTFLAIGAANRVMTSTGTAPQWVTSLTGLTGVSSSSITNTSLTSGRVVFSGASGVQTDSANLTFNGTTLSATGFSTTGLSTLVQTVTVGNSNFSGTAVFAPSTPAKLYIGTGTVTDTTSAIGATNATGAVSSLAITPIAATNTSVTYTNAATLYIAGAPSAGTNVTLTNPYALYVAAGTSYFDGNVGIGTSTPAAKLNTSIAAGSASATNIHYLLSETGTNSDTGMQIKANNSTNSWDAGAITFRREGAANSYGLQFATSSGGTNATQMTLNSSGNLGLGVTPSAWAGQWKALQIGSGALSYSGVGSFTSTQVSDNACFTGSGADTVTSFYIYGSTPATNYKQYNGQHRWYNAPSGSANASITFTQAMTLTAAGNLLVNATSAAAASTYIQASSTSGNGNNAYIGVFTGGSGATSANHNLGIQFGTTVNSIRTTYDGSGNARNDLVFQINSADVAAFTSTGNFGIGNTGPTQRLRVEQNTNSSTWANIANSSAGNGAGAGVLFTTDQGDAGGVFQNSSGNAAGAGANFVRIRNLLNHGISFETNNTEKARFTSGGTFKINNATNTVGTNNLLIVGSGNTQNDNIAVINTANANVGGLLISNWDGTTTTQGPRISFDNSGRGSWAMGGGNGANTFDITQTWGSTPAFRIDGSNNVNIGVSSGTARLTVESSSGIALRANTPSGTTQAGIAEFYNTTNGGYLAVAGVGTSSVVPTWPNGAMVIESVPASSGGFVIDAYQGDLIFQNGRNNSGRFTSSGNLLVGTTSGSNKLLVSGTNTIANFTASGLSTSAQVQIQADNGAGFNARIYMECPGSNAGGFGYVRSTSRLYAWNQTEDSGPYVVANGTSWTTNSDARLKTNVQTLSYGLTSVLALLPKEYEYKVDEGKKCFGFIAQDVVNVIPELVDVPEDSNEMMGIEYQAFIPVLVKAIQEQQAIIESLKARLDAANL